MTGLEILEPLFMFFVEAWKLLFVTTTSLIVGYVLFFLLVDDDA